MEDIPKTQGLPVAAAIAVGRRSTLPEAVVEDNYMGLASVEAAVVATWEGHNPAVEAAATVPVEAVDYTAVVLQTPNLEEARSVVVVDGVGSVESGMAVGGGVEDDSKPCFHDADGGADVAPSPVARAWCFPFSFPFDNR